jgi:GTP-binding protein Era
MAEEKDKFKSGFVVLIGRSNVGKSTLINSLVGTKVAITSPKPQTTRHIIQGVLHDARGQAVFIDTPGIFQKSYDRLTSTLTRKAREAIHDVNLILYVVDPTRAPGKEENTIFNLLQTIKLPKILVVNKIDLRERPYSEDYQDWQNDFDEYIEISALKQKHLKPLVDLIFKYLPIGQAY